MDKSSNAMSLGLEQRENAADEGPTLPSVGPTGVEDVRFLSPEHRESFRGQLSQLLTEFDISDPRKEVPMKEFLKWRMRCLWFLYRHLGGAHPYTSEFVSTVEREADPHGNGRSLIGGQAILEALLCDLDDGFLCRNDAANG